MKVLLVDDRTYISFQKKQKEEENPRRVLGKTSPLKDGNTDPSINMDIMLFTYLLKRLRGPSTAARIKPGFRQTLDGARNGWLRTRQHCQHQRRVDSLWSAVREVGPVDQLKSKISQACSALLVPALNESPNSQSLLVDNGNLNPSKRWRKASPLHTEWQIV